MMGESGHHLAGLERSPRTAKRDEEFAAHVDGVAVVEPAVATMDPREY
jgi:hypothetical protein